MSYDYNHPDAPLNPAEPSSWCFVCNGPRAFAYPVPPVQQRRTAAGVVTLREGACRDCGGPLWRVGGGRGADPEAPEAPTPGDGGPDDLFAGLAEDPA